MKTYSPLQIQEWYRKFFINLYNNNLSIEKILLFLYYYNIPLKYIFFLQDYSRLLVLPIAKAFSCYTQLSDLPELHVFHENRAKLFTYYQNEPAFLVILKNLLPHKLYVCVQQFIYLSTELTILYEHLHGDTENFLDYIPGSASSYPDKDNYLFYPSFSPLEKHFSWLKPAKTYIDNNLRQKFTTFDWYTIDAICPPGSKPFQTISSISFPKKNTVQFHYLSLPSQKANKNNYVYPQGFLENVPYTIDQLFLMFPIAVTLRLSDNDKPATIHDYIAFGSTLVQPHDTIIFKNIRFLPTPIYDLSVDEAPNAQHRIFTFTFFSTYSKELYINKLKKENKFLTKEQYIEKLKEEGKFLTKEQYIEKLKKEGKYVEPKQIFKKQIPTSFTPSIKKKPSKLTPQQHELFAKKHRHFIERATENASHYSGEEFPF